MPNEEDEMGEKQGRWIWGITIVWGVIGLVLVVVALGQERPTPTAGQPVAPEAGLRTLIVSDVQPAAASTPSGPLHASLVRGETGPTPTVATVLSDEDCAPDAQGYSHCLNRLEMPGGGVVAVRHIHRMTEVPCLAPGERVNLQSS